MTSADALDDRPGLVRVVDSDRVRTVTLDRAEALNAFNEALYDAVTDTILNPPRTRAWPWCSSRGAAGHSVPGPIASRWRRGLDPDFMPGAHGFPGLIDALIGSRNR